MIPAFRLVLLACFPVVLAFVAVMLPGVVVPMIAFDIVLLLVAVVDLAMAFGAVQVERSFGPVQAIGRTFDITLTIRNEGRRRLQVRINDDFPGLAEGLPIALRLRRHERTAVVYSGQIDRRGEHRFGPVTVRWRSPLGLWERQRSCPVDGAVRVYPDFAQLRSYGLAARNDERRAPVRSRRRPGGENEFERLRPYVAGDPYRHIDWRATARRRDFVTREFGQEVNQNLILLLDCGRMMSARNGAMSSFDHALNAALMMGQVALRHGDRVGLMAFDRTIRVWLPPKGGARSGSRLIRGTYDVFPTLHEPDYALAFRHLSHRVRRRSLVVLFTSVVDEVNAELTDNLLKGLAGRHLPLCVWIRDMDVHDLLERPAASPVDSYIRGAAAEIAGWRERTLANVRRRGALVVDAPPDRLTPDLPGRYLEIKARRLL